MDADGDGTDELAWSWHIWVTDTDLTEAKEGSNSYMFAPANVGWCDTKISGLYNARSFYVRAVQLDSSPLGASSPVLVQETAHRTVSYYGNSPYYQWGRKDALFSNKSQYGRYPTNTVVSSATTLDAVIKTPATFYNTSRAAWNTEANSYNLWSAENTVATMNDNAVIKTIYDPCPAGYHMPASNAYTGFITLSDDYYYNAGVGANHYSDFNVSGD